jgi:hypothetical protein
MHKNRDAYPELVYAIAADRVRAMGDEQVVRQARRARRRRRALGMRAFLRSLSTRR